MSATAKLETYPQSTIDILKQVIEKLIEADEEDDVFEIKRRHMLGDTLNRIFEICDAPDLIDHAIEHILKRKSGESHKLGEAGSTALQYPATRKMIERLIKAFLSEIDIFATGSHNLKMAEKLAEKVNRELTFEEIAGFTKKAKKYSDKKAFDQINKKNKEPANTRSVQNSDRARPKRMAESNL